MLNHIPGNILSRNDPLIFRCIDTQIRFKVARHRKPMKVVLDLEAVHRESKGVRVLSAQSCPLVGP